MSLKLSRKKEWLTLEDSAKCLSLLIGEEVTTADLLQLATQKDLKLTIKLAKSYSCFFGKKVSLQDANVWRFHFKDGEQTQQSAKLLPGGEKRVFLPDVVGMLARRDGRRGLILSAMLSEANVSSNADSGIAYEGVLLPDNNGVLEFNKEKIEAVTGFWDLSMIGSEILDIEDAWYDQIDGSSIDELKPGGVILTHPFANRWATLYERRSNEYGQADPRDFDPMLSLPRDEKIGIRQSELQRFADTLNEPDETSSADELEFLPDDFRVLYETMGKGELPHMDTLIAAWRTFWKDRRPNDGKEYPINTKVAAWIKSRMEKPSTSMANQMASIIRPTWAPVGRQTNHNQ